MLVLSDQSLKPLKEMFATRMLILLHNLNPLPGLQREFHLHKSVRKFHDQINVFLLSLAPVVAVESEVVRTLLGVLLVQVTDCQPEVGHHFLSACRGWGFTC